MKQLAIIGATSSGKTALALKIAHQTNSWILSLDSLLVYKQINIASAKPNKTQRENIKHFGIDEVYPNQDFGVIDFIQCYQRAYNHTKQNNKNLIITGGSSFYLKVLIDGISPSSKTPPHIKQWAKAQLLNQKKAYEFLKKLDNQYMQKISPNDTYRLEKALCIYKQHNTTPTKFFAKNKKQKTIKQLNIYEISPDTQTLRQNIQLRTKQMLKDGLIDEVIQLEQKYSRKYKPMHSIGISQTLDYLDSKIDINQLQEQINTQTARLAKKQKTFNAHQFKENIIRLPLNKLEKEILKFF